MTCIWFGGRYMSGLYDNAICSGIGTITIGGHLSRASLMRLSSMISGRVCPLLNDTPTRGYRVIRAVRIAARPRSQADTPARPRHMRWQTIRGVEKVHTRRRASSSVTFLHDGLSYTMGVLTRWGASPSGCTDTPTGRRIAVDLAPSALRTAHWGRVLFWLPS